jgi:hypothetical protein
MSASTPTRVKVVGTKLSPRFVTADVTFVDGDATVTAGQLEANLILGFAGGAWDAAAGVPEVICTETPYVAGGVASIALRKDTSAPADGVDEVHSMLFWVS